MIQHDHEVMQILPAISRRFSTRLWTVSGWSDMGRTRLIEVGLGLISRAVSSDRMHARIESVQGQPTLPTQPIKPV